MRQSRGRNHRPPLALVRKASQTEKSSAIAVVVLHRGDDAPPRVRRIDIVVESEGMAYGNKVRTVSLPVVIYKAVLRKGHVPHIAAVARHVEVSLCVSAYVAAVMHRAGIINRISTDSDVDIRQQVPDSIYRAVPVRVLVSRRRRRANLALEVFRDIEDNRRRIDRAVGGIIFRRQPVRCRNKPAAPEYREDSVAVADLQVGDFHPARRASVISCGYVERDFCEQPPQLEDRLCAASCSIAFYPACHGDASGIHVGIRRDTVGKI